MALFAPCATVPSHTAWAQWCLRCRQRRPEMALLDGLSILYVEDEPDTREVITLGLERHGARVQATDSASAALLMFETQRPDVIIADLELPEVDGWTFIRAVRRRPMDRDRRTPAIALT